MNPQKLSQEEVKDLFLGKGCQLLSPYKNVDTPVEYRCICGTISKIRVSKFKKGQRCQNCKYKKLREVNLYTLEEIQQALLDEGCTLTSSYKGIFDKITFVCSCGRNAEMSFQQFKKSKACPDCNWEKLGEKRRPPLEYLKKFYENQGCVLLCDKYKNAHTKMNYICRCGKPSSSTFANFKKGKCCKECGIKKISGENHGAWIPDREEAALRALMQKRCNSLVRRCLKPLKINKLAPSEALLGYTRKEFRAHIESHPNWHHVREMEWHVDHIFPVQAFVDFGILDLKIINHLNNLQPLEGKENLRKGCKYDSEKFKLYLEKMNCHNLQKLSSTK